MSAEVAKIDGRNEPSVCEIVKRIRNHASFAVAPHTAKVKMQKALNV